MIKSFKLFELKSDSYIDRIKNLKEGEILLVIVSSKMWDKVRGEFETLASTRHTNKPNKLNDRCNKHDDNYYMAIETDHNGIDIIFLSHMSPKNIKKHFKNSDIYHIEEYI